MGMGKNMENGMVLAMSAWYAKETYTNGRPQGSQTGMSWLDGVNDWSGIKKAGPCDKTTSDEGGPFHATFSNIRIGYIGTTRSIGTISETFLASVFSASASPGKRNQPCSLKSQGT